MMTSFECRRAGSAIHHPVSRFEMQTFTGRLRLIAHNFVIVGDNLKNCSMAYIRTYNRRLKFHSKFTVIGEILSEKHRGVKCFDSHCNSHEEAVTNS